MSVEEMKQLITELEVQQMHSMVPVARVLEGKDGKKYTVEVDEYGRTSIDAQEH